MKTILIAWIAVFFSQIAVALSPTLCGMYDCPEGAPSSNDVIERPIYVLSNNGTTKFADWLAYQVTPDTIDGPKRSRGWKSDPDIPANRTLEKGDYRRAHAMLDTDRGHQVPLASFSNTPHWRMTNYLSNITPQASDLNQGPWVRLETAVRNLARTGVEVYVVTGPLYEQPFGVLPEADESHTIPSGYFKVVFTISSSDWVDASGFIMEQNSGRGDNYCNKETTIDEIEERSGLDIMPALPWWKEGLEGKLGGLSIELGC